jgi:hypothetical protein
VCCFPPQMDAFIGPRRQTLFLTNKHKSVCDPERVKDSLGSWGSLHKLVTVLNGWVKVPSQIVTHYKSWHGWHGWQGTIFLFFFNVDERIANVYPKPFPSCLGPLLICAQYIGQRMLIDRKPRTCFPLRMGMQAQFLNPGKPQLFCSLEAVLFSEVLKRAGLNPSYPHLLRSCRILRLCTNANPLLVALF